MIIQICVGSACHLNGSEEIVDLFQEAIREYKLEKDVTLAGTFCTGNCNRVGVTVIIDDIVYRSVVPNNFDDFFKEKVLNKLNLQGK